MSAEEIRQRMNKSLSLAMVKDEDGNFKPPVCIICDRFIPINNIQTISATTLETHADKFLPNRITNIPSDLAECYKVDHLPPALSKCLLSPRATYRDSGFTSCITCKQALNSNKIPRFCIANNYCFGDTPDCLLQLTDIELALITNIKTFGFCFTFTGGKQRELKGSLSYYKVKKESIVRSIAQLEGLNLNRNVVVILYGTMTAKQHEKAQQKHKIRIDYVSSAVRWLICHNSQWKHLESSYQKIVDSIQNPYFVDNSIIIDNMEENQEHNDVEDSETFQVFYPDGQISTVSCGQHNVDEFREIVSQASQQGFNMEYRCSQLREAVADYKDENLVNACLLQFPYGRGAMNEDRMKNDGSISTSVDVKEYIQYLSMLSLRQFHRDLFTLILYNMYMKQMMVRKANLKAREKGDSTLFAQELTFEDVNAAIHARRTRTQSCNETNHPGGKFLGAIDVVCQTVPHSNEAARKARRNVECLQHHFGCPTFFLTVTPDDDNHFLIQVYTDILIDDDTDIGSLSDEQLSVRAKKRTELRIKFPGICAYFFEIVLNIIIKDVIGWDETTEQPIAGFTGLFGTPTAFSETTEEQGRKTLHGHFLIWIAPLNALRELLHAPGEKIRKQAASIIAAQLDNVASCKCFFNDDRHNRSRRDHRLFPHECKLKSTRNRHNPKVISDQQLRDLRLKGNSEKPFVFCPDCDKKWTNKQLLSSYLTDIIKVPNFSGMPDNVRRLKSMAIQYQKEERNDKMISSFIVNAAYNNHIHTDSCFKPQKNTKTIDKHKERDECRYRYPQREKKSTTIQDASETTVSWYLWTGECLQRYIKEVNIQRNPLDAFQNVYCKIISESAKIPCNSNLLFVMPGPIAQYCVTYTTKGTQKDDTEAYEHVKHATEKALSSLRKHEGDTAEAVRRILATSFSHQVSNVAGTSLAAFCTRNESRFRVSHTIVWCPLRDIKTLLKKQKVASMIRLCGNDTYFQCHALHYLCRPTAVEACCPFDFYSQYDIIKATSQNDTKDCPRFINTDEFQHPSFLESQAYFREAIKKRAIHKLSKITQYDFPDTASFSSALTDPEGEINENMEQYSEQVLLLFHHYRKREDLYLHNSFTKLLRCLIFENKLHPMAPMFLQNIQDTKCNNFRMTLINDDLQRHTVPPYFGDDIPLENVNEEMEQDMCQMNSEYIDELINTLDLELLDDDQQFQDADAILSNYSSKSIRHRGRLNCGYDAMPDNSIMEPIKEPFVEYKNETELESNMDPFQHDTDPLYIPSKSEIVTLLIEHSEYSKQVLMHVDNKPIEHSVLQANGSARSIINWSTQAKLDRKQRRAFEIITSSFVLSFFNNTSGEEDGNRKKRKCTTKLFEQHKRKLEILSERHRKKSNQLIMFLHGAGGSGKTAVINLVTKYCRSYCQLLTNDINDASRCVIVTAMTGVAATLLNGQTLHSAVYLNQRRRITEDQVELWMKTKMIIIDEISFASKSDLQKLHTKLIELKQNTDEYYGGIHIIFSGDMRQLEPVGNGKKNLHSEDVPHFRDWVNSYIELDGMYRYHHDPEWGALLQRFRNGTATLKDIRKINNRVISSNFKLPPDIKYATYYNLDRDSINCAIFEERAQKYYLTHQNTNGFIMIFSDDIKMKKNGKTFQDCRNKRFFWETCGESDISFKGRQSARMDPVLKLYHGCPIMLPTNICVPEGQANGTQAVVDKIFLKPGANIYQTKLDNGTPITSVFASQVEYIQAKHCNASIDPSLFQVKPKQHSFTARFPRPKDLQSSSKDKYQYIEMQAKQIPIISSNATTGHKLQGSGVETLFVHNWSYQPNWVYVMLSRLTTSEGLYARVPLRTNLDEYKLSKSYTTMIQNFEQTRQAQLFTNKQYKTILQDIH